MPLSTYLQALRIHQWTKNLLVFVPLVLGGKFNDASAWAYALAGFCAISALASSSYLINDLCDLEEDRKHWSKRSRPLASGALPVSRALVLAGFGVLASLSIGTWAGTQALAILAGYFALSLLYSFRLKREPILDVLVLTSLFTTRLGLGVAVTNVRFSAWLFVFSMFLFLSLSLAKRCTEITRMTEHEHDRTPGRGYLAADEPLVLALGVSAMLGAVLILVIYLITDAFPAAFYTHPQFLWAIPIVLFAWLGRVWLLCHRGLLDDDPVTFALNDKLSLAYGGVSIVAFLAAVLW